MDEFLSILKQKLADAQVRLADATKRFQTAQAELQAVNSRFQPIQAEYQSVAQETQSLAKIIEVETRRQALPQESSPNPGSLKPASATAVATGTLTVTPTVTATPVVEVNKTELVLEVLEQHPGGLTPAELWRTVKLQIPSRAYVYAVLGRLKNRERVTVRRGKYIYRSRPEEAKPLPTIQ